MTEATQSDELPRQLIVCCDGTNNTLTAGSKDTNVLRFVTHLASHPAPERIVYYDPGVGSPDAVPPTDPIDWAHRTWERVSGLASGRGVYGNIGLAYLFLMRNWRDERDRIYCFGFSRGAFTARGVAGMVNLFGILRPEHEALLPTLIGIYFSQPGVAKGTIQQATRDLHLASRKSTAPIVVRGPAVAVTRELLGKQVRDLFTSPAGHDAWVHWVGVWDTVESVGLPGPLARTNPSTATVIGKRIRNVRHALSFDEHRWTFVPRLYEEPADIAGNGDNQTLKQRWFAGVHCDVGGGYSTTESRMSDESLEWMVSEVAADLGIPMLPAPGGARVRHDALWDTPWWALAGMCLRSMQPQTASGAEIETVAAPCAAVPSESVWKARRKAWPLVAAALAGIVFLLLSGACLVPAESRSLSVANAVAFVHAARSFACDQLASLWGEGMLAAGGAPWEASSQPAWSMFWDFGLIACYGYLLARASSRSFAWLAAARGPSSPLPLWRVLGMAPLLAFGGDVGENILTLFSLALHSGGTDLLAFCCLWIAGIASMIKLAGLFATTPLLVLRCWLAFPGVPRSRG